MRICAIATAAFATPRRLQDGVVQGSGAVKQGRCYPPRRLRRGVDNDRWPTLWQRRHGRPVPGTGQALRHLACALDTRSVPPDYYGGGISRNMRLLSQLRALGAAKCLPNSHRDFAVFCKRRPEFLRRRRMAELHPAQQQIVDGPCRPCPSPFVGGSARLRQSQDPPAAGRGGRGEQARAYIGATSPTARPPRRPARRT